jgi:hypothetical protein
MVKIDKERFPGTVIGIGMIVTIATVSIGFTLIASQGGLSQVVGGWVGADSEGSATVPSIPPQQRMPETIIPSSESVAVAATEAIPSDSTVVEKPLSEQSPPPTPTSETTQEQDALQPYLSTNDKVSDGSNPTEPSASTPPPVPSIDYDSDSADRNVANDKNNQDNEEQPPIQPVASPQEESETNDQQNDEKQSDNEEEVSQTTTQIKDAIKESEDVIDKTLNDLEKVVTKIEDSVTSFGGHGIN